METAREKLIAQNSGVYEDLELFRSVWMYADEAEAEAGYYKALEAIERGEQSLIDKIMDEHCPYMLMMGAANTYSTGALQQRIPGNGSHGEYLAQTYLEEHMPHIAEELRRTVLLLWIGAGTCAVLGVVALVVLRKKTKALAVALLVVLLLFGGGLGALSFSGIGMGSGWWSWDEDIVRLQRYREGGKDFKELRKLHHELCPEFWEGEPQE